MYVSEYLQSLHITLVCFNTDKITHFNFKVLLKHWVNSSDGRGLLNTLLNSNAGISLTQRSTTRLIERHSISQQLM